MAHNNEGSVPQSGQWAPFDAGYKWFNTTENLVVPDPDCYLMLEVRLFVFKTSGRGLSWFIRLVFSDKPLVRSPQPVSCPLR